MVELEVLLLPWLVEATTIFDTGATLTEVLFWLLPLLLLLRIVLPVPLTLTWRCSCCRRRCRRRLLLRIAERVSGPVRVGRSCWAATLARNSTRRFLALAMALLLKMVVPLRPPPPLPPPRPPPLPAPPPPTTALTLLVDAIARADGIAAETVVLNAATAADGRPDGAAPAVAATNGGSLAAVGPPRRVSSG